MNLIQLESIDKILSNLKADPDHYNHGMSEDRWMQEETRRD